jgi:hypothetical protein
MTEERVFYRAKRDLPVSVGLTLVTDSVDLAQVLEHIGVHDFADEVTGALIKVIDNEYAVVYLTDDNKPWSVYARWCDVEYFSDYVEEELDIQE